MRMDRNGQRKTQAVMSMAACVAIVMAGILTPAQLMAQTFESTPIGFASVSALGLDGTTGGNGGPTVTVTDQTGLHNAISRSGPLIVQILGTIQFSGMLSVASNKTIVGLNENSGINGGGLDLNAVSNVIIRNIRFSNASVNSITVQVGSHHVWIDHCDFTNAADTLLDIKRMSSYVTVSWNHFTNTLETILQGHSDTFTADIGNLKVTYHHNWFDGTQTRHPRVRFGEPVHVFNNYYTNIIGYGVGSTMNAGVLVEGNFFRNVPQPTLTQVGSSQPGRLVQRNNIFVSSGMPQTLGSVVEPNTYYAYTLDPTPDVPSLVMKGAGILPTVSGNVTLQGCVAAAVSSQPVTFEFRPTGGGTAFARTLNLDGDGSFRMPLVPGGDYNLAIKGMKWLRKVVPVDTSRGSVSGILVTLLAGDVNNDNVISTADYLLLKAAYGSHPGDPNWNPAADLTCDDAVTTADYLLLKTNFGLFGDP